MNKLGCMADLWLFDQLTPEEKGNIQSVTRKRSYEKGKMLFMEGDPASSVFLITEGRAKLFKVSEEGKEIVLGFLTPHDLFGENVLFSESIRTMSAQAIEVTRICACDKGDFEELVSRNPSVAMKVVRTLGAKLNQVMEQLADFAMYDVRERVAHTLTRLAREYGEETSQGLRLNFRLTHEDLGTLVGASRVMVTNVLQDLRKEGHISMDAKHRFIVSPNSEHVPKIQTGLETEKEFAPSLCPCFRDQKRA